MGQIFRDEEGQDHEFPDEATPEDMDKAVRGMNRSQNIEKFKDITGIGKPSLGNEFAGGLLNAVTSLIPQNPLVYNEKSKIKPFDAYKAMGTEDKSMFTAPGLAQLAGEMFSPGKIAKESIPAIKEVGSKIKDYFSPGKHGQNVLEELGQGSKTTEENSKNLASKIMEKHDQAAEQAGSFFNHVFKQVRKDDIYTKPNPLITTSLDKAKDTLSKIKGLNIGEVQKAFEGKQSLENAHNLQSELGTWIGEFEKKPFKTPEERAELGKVKSIRDTIKSDINDFLERHDKTSNMPLKPTYQTGVDLYRENVAHYLSNEKLRKIVRGRETNIKNIHSIFDTPTNLDKGVRRVLGDLTQEDKNRILFSKIGGIKNIENPEQLFKSVFNAKNKGFSDIVSPELEQKIREGISKVKHQKILKTTGKIGAGVGGATLLEELIRGRMNHVN